MLTTIEKEILELKKKRNALILAHYYEDGEIQNIADFVGDSLFLAQKGSESDCEVVLLAGVVFMAESVKILSPDKTVLIPDMNAGCSLVSESPYKEYKKWKDSFPNSVMVTYVNSSADVKSISDVICTSSNAEKIIKAIPADKKILFGPDKHLGRWIKKVTGREMEFWNGSCQVHVLFSAQKLFDLKQQHPDALVIAHPECDDGILSQSDVIGATSKLLDTVVKGTHKKYIVATEDGIFHQMKKARPEVELIQAPTDTGCACNQCPYMKMNSLEKIRNALRDMQPHVEVNSEILQKAQIPLQRMMKITRNESVTW